MGRGRDLWEIAPGVHLVRVGRTAAASNVYLVRSGDTWVLVDAGWAGSARLITAAAQKVFGPGHPPAAIVLTHIHPDHSGAVGPLATGWNVPVYVHEAELPMAAGRYLPEYGMPLDRWVIMPIMRLLPRRTRTRIEDAGHTARYGFRRGDAGVRADRAPVADPGPARDGPGHELRVRNRRCRRGHAGPRT